ncbi:hypothetical protein ABMA28_011627 [Loxostege sticticalis]|uniref:Tick transposon n=1 Tax=Loxostege sticticalis TaxID=481309 RepID=A0ABD0S5V6_LOXSC
MDNFLNIYSSQLEKRKRSLVFGDFNIDLLKKDKYITDYVVEVKESGYEILNKINPDYCTRETSKTKTIIDHISTNINNHTFSLSIIESSLSDHKHLYLEVGKEAPRRNSKINYTAIDYDTLYNNVLKTIDKIENDYSSLENCIILNINNSKIRKRKTLNPPQKDWINKKIIDAINTRNYLWKEMKRNKNDEELKKLFRKERDKVQVMIKTCKENYYQKLFQDTQKQPKKMWEVINTLAANKIKNSPAPPKLVSDSKLVTDGTKVCDLFNLFFSSVGADLSNKIPQKYHSDTGNILMYEHNHSHDILLKELKPCTVEEVIKIIDNLDINASTGLDGISTKAIKCIKNLIVEKLVHSVNKCFRLGVFPDSLKAAKVSPIYKSGSKTDPSNYRPISVLPVLSKIFERLLSLNLNLVYMGDAPVKIVVWYS